jgi:ribokinase
MIKNIKEDMLNFLNSNSNSDSDVDVVVVGSLNVDLVVRAKRLPQAGETVAGQSFETFSGGKGFNQAVAAKRTGSRVAMIGKVGQDQFGLRLRSALQNEAIVSNHVTECSDPHTSTGTALITVDAQGRNQIVVVPGANFAWDSQEIEKASTLIQKAKMLLLQLEVPVSICIQAAQLAQQHGVKVMLTPAPVPTEPLPAALLANLDILILNETEAQQMAPLHTGISSEGLDEIGTAQLLLKALTQHQVEKAEKIGGTGKAVITTLGERGALLVTENEAQFSASIAVTPVDTTAAGDTFAGALAAALCQGQDSAAALHFANTAGALAVTKRGASDSIPTQAEVLNLL